MEDEFKLSVQPQKRVNPNIKKVVKKEVIKLFDPGLIYPISNNLWVSPVQVVSKKGGMNIVKNEKNELIPQKTITGWFSGYFHIPIAPEDQEKTTFTSLSLRLAISLYEARWKAAIDKGITGSPQPQGKSSKPDSTGLISFVMHAN
ncbi:hypothetical protein Tco_0111907 [Tanacetum coccineum]